MFKIESAESSNNFVNVRIIIEDFHELDSIYETDSFDINYYFKSWEKELSRLLSKEEKLCFLFKKITPFQNSHRYWFCWIIFKIDDLFYVTPISLKNSWFWLFLAKLKLITEDNFVNIMRPFKYHVWKRNILKKELSYWRVKEESLRDFQNSLKSGKIRADFKNYRPISDKYYE